MSQRYLEVTYRRGKPLAAYLYLPRRPGDISVRVESHGPGYLVDRAEDDRPIGIEMPSPSLFSVEKLNEILKRLEQDQMTLDDVWPLIAAKRVMRHPWLKEVMRSWFF